MANLLSPISIASSVAAFALMLRVAHGQFAGFENKGLVAVGRLSGDAFDALGAGVDTLGGIFSGMAFDVNSGERGGDAQSGFTYRGRIFCAPDRGYGAGTLDYHPRIHTLHVAVTPYIVSVRASAS